MRSLLLIAAMMLSGMAWSQPGSVIRLTNPSFEGYGPSPGNVPGGWANCGPEGESPPDTQPYCFGVTQPPYYGESYLGMVVRATGTTESVGQKLSSALKANNCYQLKLMLSRSDEYRSPTSKYNPRDSADFTTPAVLRIYGGTSLYNKVELLAETTPVDHFEWEEYVLVLQPLKSYTHIFLAADYKNANRFYNGHILVDHLSDIKWIACDDW